MRLKACSVDFSIACVNPGTLFNRLYRILLRIIALLLHILDMKGRILIIYMLIALIASQSVWAMLDEHSVIGDTAGSQELRHDGHAAEASDKGQHSDDAESCVHCCHCHFHQTSFLPPSNSFVQQTGRGAKAMDYLAWLTEAHLTTPFRPPIH